MPRELPADVTDNAARIARASEQFTRLTPGAGGGARPISDSLGTQYDTQSDLAAGNPDQKMQLGFREGLADILIRMESDSLPTHRETAISTRSCSATEEM